MLKDDFDYFLKENNLTKKEFANVLNLPYQTVNNWNDKTRPFPKWLHPFCHHYEKSLKYDKLQSLLDLKKSQ